MQAEMYKIYRQYRCIPHLAVKCIIMWETAYGESTYMLYIICLGLWDWVAIRIRDPISPISKSYRIAGIYVFYTVWRYVRKDCSHRNKPLHVTTVEHEV